MILTLSCKEKDEFTVKQKEDINSFEYKLNNKPKYFLKFWEGMSEDEYYKVYNILISEKTLNTFGSYISGVGEFKISPIKENEIVIGVKISEINEDFYNLLKDKYNLPNLIDKSIIVECFVESNPCYLISDCKKQNNRGKFISITTPENLYKTTNFSQDIFMRKAIQDDKLEVTSNNANIIIKNSIVNSVINSSKISQALHKEYPFEFINFYYFESKIKNSLYNFSKEELSETRAVVISNNISITVEYYNPNYFKNQLEKQNINKQQSIEAEKSKQKIINKTKNDI